ncbi:MAG: hypothetical protein ACYC64_11135 [Armatimonadota bacterium]
MRTTIALLALLAILSSCAFGQGKITNDPNLSGTKVETDNKPDPRLAQKIAYSATRRAVVDILDDLSTTTGVTFQAGYNSKDWQVRDRKMNIFSKDARLADLMSSIARVMKFKWQLSGEGEKTTYRLYMDRKTLLDAETQSLRQEEKIEKELADKREKMLTDFGNLDSLPPQDLEKLKKEKPFMYVAASSGIASPLGRFFREVPSAAEALASAQELSLSAASLSPVAQQSILQSMQACMALGAKLGQVNKDVSPLLEDMAANAGRITLQLNGNMEHIQGSPMASSILGEINIRYGDENAGIPLFDPESKMANIFGKALIESQESGKPLNEIMKGMQGELIAAVMLQVKQDDSGEPISEHPEDSALDAKIKMKAKDPKLESVESALADATEFSVVSDSFGMSRGLVNFGDDEIVLKEALEKIADGFHYNWDKRTSILEFRDRNWFRKRNAQIPQAWIDAWKNTLKDTDTLDIGDLAQIAILTQEQFNVNIMADDDLTRSGVQGTIYPNRDWLRAYANLTESQRTAVFTEVGMNLSALTANQWSQIAKLITLRNAAYLESSDTHIILTGTKTSKDGRFEYAFSMTASDDLPPIKWTFTTPKYQEPPKEQPKEEPKKP